MTFLDRVLDKPSYGFERNNALYVPSHREIFKEFFTRLNIFASRKNWLALLSWSLSLSFTIPLFLFITKYFSLKLFAVGFVYGMVCLGSHGTVWLHRYSTHRAFTFKNDFFRNLCRNLVVKVIPEEVYVVSHHVHHQFPEKPGDPYNVHGGWLYCFLADVNHQAIAKDLDEREYASLCKLMKHTGVHANSYAQYQKWGSIAHPAYTVLHYALNWSVWYGIFFLIGGHALATCLFAWSGIWAIGVRTYNYDGHGGGKDKRQEGIDFSSRDLSINQIWPGYVAGEWHSNHHLYPNGARSGFLPYQFDMAWQFIRFYKKIGGISSYRDYKDEFFSKYYNPYLAQKKAENLQGELALKTEVEPSPTAAFSAPSSLQTFEASH